MDFESLEDGPTCRVSAVSSFATCIPKWWFFLCLLSQCGEAANPGPCPNASWQVGIFNPSGLNSKLTQAASLEGDVWFASETHLSQQGIRWFRKGLRGLKSSYKYVVPGAPCASRSQSDVGGYSGVLAMSSLPLKALPHAIPEDIFLTGRCQVVGFVAQDIWIQAGIMYGFPDSPQHLERTFQTDTILSELVQRIAIQSSGPRLIAGDFNHSTGQLHQLEHLRAMGFCEVQEYARSQWGRPIAFTTRGDALIDQIWLSRELLALLQDVCVRDMDWADHSSVQCTFSSDSAPLASHVWRMPTKVQWPDPFQGEVSVNWEDCSTTAYASWWHQLERQAGFSDFAKCGRGQTLQPVLQKHHLPVCPKGRQGDFQPSFFGSSYRHLRWVKQLRRLQALRRLLGCANQSTSVWIRVLEVWKAVRQAVGFDRGFCSWWAKQFPTHEFALGFPLLPPNYEQSQEMTKLFCKEVVQLEKQLKASSQQDAKAARAKDLSLVFQDCAKETPDKVDTLISSAQGTVELIHPDDVSIVLTQPDNFVLTHPVVINGLPKEVVHCSEDQLWLYDVSDIQVGDVVRQEVITTSDVDIMKTFESLWEPRWNRICHLDAARWDNLTEFVRATFHPIEWHFSEWSPQQIRQCAKGKKAKAAIGPDGVSRTDITSLPDWALEPASDLFTKVEQTSMLWPQQIATGMVSGLAKCPTASTPDAFRPITVYPILYRIWGTVRAKQALRSLAAVIPSSIRGGIPSRESRTIWYELAQQLEMAAISGESLNGLVLDIRKAFNSLPRMAVWVTLKQLGFPESILQAWGRFLAQQKRHFKVRQSTSEGIRSCTGYPEGDALSVLAMVVIDWVVELWIRKLSSPQINMISYVDDWQFHFGAPHLFDPLWTAVKSVTHELDLALDDDKTFVWAANNHDRAQLKDTPVACQHAARDLGAHQNYCKRAGNKTLTDRVGSLTFTWKLLRSSLAPVQLKAMAAVQLAWPRALHGVSIVKVGSQHFQSLRTGFNRGLKMDRVGSNPALVCATFAPQTDPEFWAIFQTFKDARTLGNCLSLQAAVAGLSAGDPQVPNNGPAAVLMHRVRRLGWTFTEAGSIRDDMGLFSLFNDPIALLRLRMTWSWPKVLALQVSHRKSFHGIQFADLDTLRASLKQYGPIDQAYLRCALDGTLYIDVGKEKHERGSGSKCVHCGHQDSFFHRNWECKAFESCRKNFPWPDLLPKLPKCMTCHGWPTLPAAWVTYQKLLAELPQRFFKVELPCIPQSTVVDLFVDGACACPTQARLRFASWAVTVAVPWVSLLEHRVIASGHLPGCLQSSYRAELVAIIQALKVAKPTEHKVRIWGDNKAVVKMVRRCLAGYVDHHKFSHSDLIWELVQVVDDDLRQRVQVLKVTSHCQQRLATNSLEEWAFWHNQLVDEAACAANYRRDQHFWTTWFEASESLRFQGQVLAAVQQVLLNVGRADKRLQHEQERQTTMHDADDYGQWKPPEGNEPRVDVSEWKQSAALHKKYLRTNIEAFHSWWVQVGVPILRKGGRCRWISGLQLYGDFQLSTGFAGILSRDHREWFDDEMTTPDDVTKGFATRSTKFLYIWGAYMKRNKCIISKKLMRPSSGVLACWTQCYYLPWPTERLDVVDQAVLYTHGRQVVRPTELDGYLRLESEVELPMG